MVIKIRHAKMEGEYDITVDTNELSNAICMGIRKGLFGISASDNASIDNTVIAFADMLHDIKRGL